MHVTIMCSRRGSSSSQGLFHCLLPRSFVLASFSRPRPLFICVRSRPANLSPPIPPLFAFVLDLAPQASCRRFPFLFYFVAHLLQQPPAHQNASHQPRGHARGLVQACWAIPTGLVSSYFGLTFRYCALSF
ncbi:hypothetical protein BC827DRAFT_1226879, partial [Russula dissimulans]